MVDAKRLRRFAFLASLNDEELAQLAAKVGEQVRPRNEVIFREGDVGDLFYMIESGQVAARRKLNEAREQFLGYYGPGEFFGESSLLQNTPRFATIDVVVQARLLYLNKGDFVELYEKHPAVRAAIEATAALRARRRLTTFPGKRDEEAVVLATHRHPLWIIVRAGLWSLALVPLTLVIVFFGGTLLLWLVPLLAVIYCAGLAWIYVDWKNDWFVVSSRRVLHREKVVLLFEQVEEAPLEKIQNVTSEVPSFAGNLFDFGNVIVQTAAGGGRITFDFVPKARIIRDAIEAEISRVKEHSRQSEVTQLRQNIRTELQRELGITHDLPPAQQPQSAVKVETRTSALKRMIGSINFIPPTYSVKGDQIIWRKHVFLLLRDTAIPALLLLLVVPISLYLIISDLFGVGPVPLPVALALAAIVMPICIIWLWYRYRDWENDIYVLTPERVVDSERKPFWLQERVRVASLGQVQNVRFERNTIIENILDYGTVIIQTAGQDNDLTFDEIPHPRQAQGQISDALERFKARASIREREARRREFLDWFGEYHKLLTASQSGNGQQQPPSAER